MVEERPNILNGKTFKMKTGCGKLYITINSNGSDAPFEILAKIGKTGGCVASQIEAISRLISTTLQNGIDSKVIIKHLKGIRCPANNDKMDAVTSCADAFAQALEEFVGEKVNIDKKHIYRPADE